MELRQRVTGSLAWVGLAVIIAVPAAQFALSHFGDAGALSADSAPAPASAETDTVAPQAAAPVSTVVTPKAVIVTPQAAAVAPKTTPTPASAPVAASVTAAPRPHGAGSVTQPAASDTATASAPADPIGSYLTTNKALPDYITPSTAPPAAAAPAPQAASIAPSAVSPVAPKPVPAPMATTTRPKQAPQAVTEADLKDWKTGSLREYLREHDLLSNDDASPSDTTPPSTVGSGDGN